MQSIKVFKTVLLGLMVLTARPAWTAPINLGDFAGTTVTFKNVVADDGPLFGTPVVNGNALEFASPQLQFQSTSSGGGSQSTPGILTFGVSAKPGFVINSFSASENGLFSLFGRLGTFATNVVAAISMTISVDEVDGIPIAQVDFSPVTASVGFNLISNPGEDNPWSMGVTGNVEAALILNSVPFTFGATHLLIELSNTLTAESELNTTASMQKDFLKVSAVTSPGATVPEPNTSLLIACGLILLGATRLQRRG